MKRTLLIFLFAFLPYLLVAQYFSMGEDPSGIRWRQINTTNFQIIYPADFETKAQRMASIFEKVYSFAGLSLKNQPRKISVILHTSTVRSNGFVGWAPARVELFTTPGQEVYAQDWLDQLAIHEFRHVVQINKIGTELPEIFKIILGEQAAVIAIAAYLPFWFIEGDAVVTETALSHSGRGRVPSFGMELKAQSVEKGFFSYDKAYLGSYKDHVSDYYQLGYQLVAGIRNKYGTDSWSNVLNNVARHPLSLNAFSHGLKKVTGKNLTGVYKEVFNELKDSWSASDKALKKTEFELITKQHSGYISYRYPYPLSDSTFFAVRYSINDLTKFVTIGPKGGEKTIFTPGNIAEESVTYGKGKVFWIEVKPDVRWANREFSQLRILNLSNGNVTEKKYPYKIFAPSLSPDGQYLAAVKLDNVNHCSIVLLSPGNGEIIKEMPFAADLYMITPSWDENNKGLFAVVLGDKGKSIAKIDPFTGTINYLFPFSHNEISRPVQRGNFVYYTGTIGGTDNIYAFNLVENKNYCVTSSRFGARDAQVSSDGRYLVYSNYTSDGFKVVKMAMSVGLFSLSDPAVSFNYKLADQLGSQEKGIPDFSKLDTITYASKRYSKLAHLFNFHSWAPAHIDAETEEIRPGVSLMSQNKLSTAVTQLGYDYSTVNKTGKWVAKFDYTGLFPVLKLKADYGREKSRYLQITEHKNSAGQVVSRDSQLISYAYKVLNMNGGVSIPLNLSHGKMYRLVQPEFQIGYTQTWLEGATPFSNTIFIPLTYRLYAQNLLQQGHRDLQPALGQVIDLIYRYSPFGNRNYGTIWSAEGTLYFPGLVKHHGLRIYGGYQQRQTIADRSFSDLISYPRGYTNLDNSQLFSIKSDYVLPLFYPDWSLGKLSYFKRFSLRIFYDYAQAMVPLQNQRGKIIGEYNKTFSSAGGELTADCNFLRLLVPAKIGVRSSYLLESKTVNFEFLFSVNLNGF
jgi:hypothetical protein